jgi:hypothetical protein
MPNWFVRSLISMPSSIDGLAKGGDESPDHVAVTDDSGADEAAIGIMAQTRRLPR